MSSHSIQNGFSIVWNGQNKLYTVRIISRGSLSSRRQLGMALAWVSAAQDLRCSTCLAQLNALCTILSVIDCYFSWGFGQTRISVKIYRCSPHKISHS